jgi:hypothetical protein
MGRKMPPIHPGEILLEEFLKPLNISQYRSVQSPLTQRCDSPDTSGVVKGSGSIFRLGMIWNWRRIALENDFFGKLTYSVKQASRSA